MALSIAAIIKNDEGRFLIAKRKPGGSLSNLWEFPGGKCEDGETPEEALNREMLEEFEIPAKSNGIIATGTFQHKGEDFELLAIDTVLEHTNFILNEHTEIRWVRHDQLADFDFAPSDIQLFAQLI